MLESFRSLFNLLPHGQAGSSTGRQIRSIVTGPLIAKFGSYIIEASWWGNLGLTLVAPLVIWFRIDVSGKFWTHVIGFSQFSKTISIGTTSAANRPLQHLVYSLTHCPSFRACSECKTIFTQESLLEFEPMIGFGKYNRWIQTPNNSGIFSITNTHDLCWSAYSRWGNHSLQNEGNLGSGHAHIIFGSFFSIPWTADIFTHSKQLCFTQINTYQAYTGTWTDRCGKPFGQTFFMESRTHCSFSGKGRTSRNWYNQLTHSGVLLSISFSSQLGPNN